MTADIPPFQRAIALVMPVRVSATIEFDPLDLVIGHILHEATNMSFEEFLNADFRFWAFVGATSSHDPIVRTECRGWLRQWGSDPTCRAALESFRETRAMVAIEWDQPTWEWLRALARPTRTRSINTV